MASVGSRGLMGWLGWRCLSILLLLVLELPMLYYYYYYYYSFTAILCNIPLLATTSSKVFSLLHILTTLLLLLIHIILFCLFRNRTNSSSFPLPPGPTPWSFIGNLPQLYLNKPKFKWIHGIMKSLNTDIACIRVASVHLIPVTCPEIAREFLIKHDAIFASRPITMAAEYISHGFLSVITAPWGDQWKKMRRVTTELLNPSRMRWLHDKRAQEANNLVFYIHNHCKQDGTGGNVNLRVATRAYCGNVIRRLMFNKRYFGDATHDGGPSFAEEEHVEALFTGLSFLYSFCISDYIPSLRWFDLQGHENIMKTTTATIEKYHTPIIETRIQQWEDGKNNGLCVKKKPEDLLDILVSLEDNKKNRCLSTQEIKALVSELLYATIDNPSNVVEWALAEMINQPHILRKAVEEIDIVVGKDRLVQESDIPKLNYVKACARESFRLHPLEPFNPPHVSMADTTVAGYFIPKGSHVLLSRLGLGRNPKVWDEPLKFKPKRHINGSTSVELNETGLQFISFSAGRRGCMGVSLGSTMTTMLLARLLQGFHWVAPLGESTIDLCESSNDLMLAKPLHAHATPRLPSHVYQMNLENL